ncbi:MAG: CopD family protein [Bdellovibrionales bacterium]
MLLAFKALHLIAMVAWFAGLFYMFRLFVYHAENADKKEVTNVLKVMERKLLYFITWPAMVVTLTAGFTMLTIHQEYLGLLWIQLKLGLIALLIAYTVFLGYVRRRFAEDEVFLCKTVPIVE